jgi:hypothetical protein
MLIAPIGEIASVPSTNLTVRAAKLGALAELSKR